MPPFSVSNVSAVFLFGQEACERYEQLIHYWHAILKPADWERLLFIQVTDTPVQPKGIPAGLMEPLSRNSYRLEPGASLPPQIAQALMSKMEGGQVMAHCVCSDLDRQGQQAVHPAVLMKSLGEYFSSGLKVIYYLMLKYSFGENIEGQRAFLTELAGVQPNGQGVNAYLVSKVASDFSLQKDSACWRALLHEVLINSASRRTLSEGKLYSLGYSVLNADDSELRNLRIYRMSQLAAQMVQRDFSMAEALQIITPGLESRGAHGLLENEVREWLSRQVQARVSLPGEKERETNRLLSRTAKGTQESIALSIRRFFRLNNRKVDWSAHFSGNLAEMKRQLAARINAPAFPQPLLETLITHLRNLEQVDQPSVPQARKSFLNPMWRNDYAKEVEQHFRDYYLTGNLTRAAAAYRAICEQLLSTLKLLKQHGGTAEFQAIDENQYDYLSGKYPSYNQSVQDISHAQTDRVFPLAWLTEHAPYYGPDGRPLEAGFERLCQAGEKLLQQEMPPAFRGSFTHAVSAECDSDEELSLFFDQNLLGSKRMLHNIHDAGHKSQSLYFADSAFQRHPWIINKQAECVIAENDNVERIDLYPLAHSIAWYLGDETNRYFYSLHQENAAQGAAGRLFDLTDTAAARPGAGSAPVQRDMVQDSTLNDSLDIRIDDGAYILYWDWKQGAPNATVKIVQQGRVLMDQSCSNAAFISGQGVNVTERLPYGKVTVSILSDHEVYLTRDLPGKRRVVFYSLERVKDGTMELRLEGKPDDVARLVLYVPGEYNRPECYYPIQGEPDKTRHIFRKLRLGDSAEVCTDPGDEFPEVMAIKKNTMSWRSDV